MRICRASLRQPLAERLIMRPSFLAAALALSACSAIAPAIAEDVRPSQTACDAKKIGGRELADCLRAGADHPDKELAAVVEAAIKSIDAPQGLLSSQKSPCPRSPNAPHPPSLRSPHTPSPPLPPFQ